MTASNLAICFAPSLFHVYGVHGGGGGGGGSGGSLAVNGTSSTGGGARTSPRRQDKPGCPGLLPDDDELVEQKAALDCLTFMIVNVNDLFTVIALGGTLAKLRIVHST